VDKFDTTPNEINTFHDFYPRSPRPTPHWRLVLERTGMDVGLDDRTLRRIIATFVALALLAERAGARSLPVRWLVLSILRYVEGVARVYVVDVTQLTWQGFDEDLAPGSSPDDAALLAWRLRLLAAVLGTLLPPEDRLFGEAVRMVRALGRAHGAARRAGRCLPVTPGGWPHQAPDTS